MQTHLLPGFLQSICYKENTAEKLSFMCTYFYLQYFIASDTKAENSKTVIYHKVTQLIGKHMPLFRNYPIQIYLSCLALS